MERDQEIRLTALEMAGAAAGDAYGSTSAESLVAYARVLEGYIRGPVVMESVSDVDAFYCAGAVSGGTDARRGCSHPRHSHGPHGCTMGHGSMAVPNCPCERPNGD